MATKKYLLSITIAVIIAVAFAVPNALAEAEPVSHWKFDEGTGTTAKDSVGDNDGTLSGATWMTEGVSGSALEFDGTDDYVTAPTVGDYSKGTWELWAKSADDGSADIVLLSAYLGFGSDNYWLEPMRAYGRILWVLGGSSAGVLVWGPDLSSGVWHHIVATWDFDTDKFELFLDGVSVGSATKDIDKLTTPPTTVNIGRSVYAGGIYYWSGAIDEVRLYNTVLTAEDIKAHHKRRK